MKSVRLRSVARRSGKKLNLVQYVNLESAKDGYDGKGIGDAVDFLKDFNPSSVSDVEIEMCIMHAAFLVDPRNTFRNNYNVSNKKIYIDHINVVKESDISAWCQKLHDLYLWQYGNRIIVNIVFNWLKNSFNIFERIVP